MITVKYDEYKLVLDKNPKTVNIDLITNDETVFKTAHKSFINDKWVSGITSPQQIKLLNWLEYIKFSGTLTESDDLGIITTDVNFINGKISDLPDVKYSCYRKLFGIHKTYCEISIIDGKISKTNEIVFRRGDYYLFGMKEINVHDLIRNQPVTNWISHFDGVLWEVFDIIHENYIGVVGYKIKNLSGDIFPLFGGKNISLSKWYENSGLTMDDLAAISYDDWKLIYQECKLFHKEK